MEPSLTSNGKITGAEPGSDFFIQCTNDFFTVETSLENHLSPANRAPRKAAMVHSYPEQQYQANNCRVQLFKHGELKYTKASYPVRTGIYSELETAEYWYHFNLNDEIIRIIGKTADWPHPHEWLKRTAGNDWIYYSTGGYTGVFETTGEYYLPNLPYSTNNALGGRPFDNSHIQSATRDWHHNLITVKDTLQSPDRQLSLFLDSVIAKTPAYLSQKSQDFRRCHGGPVTVLPPDTRHVDYNVMPLSLSEGCLYKCRFCKVKNNKVFSVKHDSQIVGQINRLRQFYADDLYNHNSVFIGEHDGLNSGPQKLLFTIGQAVDRLSLEQSWYSGSNFFLFGSVFSLLNTPGSLFDELSAMASNIYINVGLESADQETLDMLGKPLTAQLVTETFDLIQEINDRYPNIEITSNFVIDDALTASHYQTLISLIRDRFPRKKSKGCIYLSPLRFDSPSRAQLFKFYRLKIQSRLPLFLYTIQKL